MSQYTHTIRLTLLTLIAFSGLMGLSSTSHAGFFDQKTTGFSTSSDSGFLPVEQAFHLEAGLKGSTLTLTWQIEPEHYLYRSRFSVKSLEPKGAVLTAIHIPRGEQVHDEFQGDVEILRDRVTLSYRVDLPAEILQQGIVVAVTFQGCAEAGLCYPPRTQHLNLVRN